jgi:hypothetical protein
MVKRRRFLWATIIYVALSFIITILLLSVICLPTWRNWYVFNFPLTNICLLSFTNDIFVSRVLSDKMCSIKSIKTNFEITWALNIIGDLLSMSIKVLIVKVDVDSDIS